MLYWGQVAEIFCNIINSSYPLEFDNSMCWVLRLVAVNCVIGFQPLLHCYTNQSFSSVCSCGKIWYFATYLFKMTKTTIEAHSTRNNKPPCLISKYVTLSGWNVYQKEGKTCWLFLLKLTKSDGVHIASELAHKTLLQLVIVPTSALQVG